MKVFISWSGPRSRAVAEALNDWLVRVIQAVRPFFSPDIEKGAKWSSEIDAALEGTHFGIVCLTPDNLKSEWIHYEAGALSKTPDARIWTYLHGLKPSDVPQPLGRFQHTIADKEDTLKLLRSLNARIGDVGGEPLKDQLLEESFEFFWPKLEEKLREAAQLAPKVTSNTSDKKVSSREERDILNEILELVRNQQRRLSVIERRNQNTSRIESYSNDDDSYIRVEFVIPHEINPDDVREVESYFNKIKELSEEFKYIRNLKLDRKNFVPPRVIINFELPIDTELIKLCLSKFSVATGHTISIWAAEGLPRYGRIVGPD